MGRLGAGNGAGDMTKAVYDTDENDVVDNSEKLENSTKAQVQDHTPKAHNQAASTITSEQFPLVRMPRGTDTFVLTGKGAGVSPAYEAAAGGGGPTIATGSYTGNESARQITTGFKCSLVIIQTTNGNQGDESHNLIPNMTLRHTTSAVQDILTFLYLHASDGFFVSSGQTVNQSGSTYYYWAISE